MQKKHQFFFWCDVCVLTSRKGWGVKPVGTKSQVWQRKFFLALPPSHSNWVPILNKIGSPWQLGAVFKRGTWGYDPKYFLKKYFWEHPMHCSWWCSAGCDALQVEMHYRLWCTEEGDAPKLVMHWRWWCTEGGDALQVVMHFLLIHRFLLSLL